MRDTAATGKLVHHQLGLNPRAESVAGEAARNATEIAAF
jgi:hypothetical protein